MTNTCKIIYEHTIDLIYEKIDGHPAHVRHFVKKKKRVM